MVKRGLKSLIPVVALCHLGAAAAIAVPQAYSHSETHQFKAWREQAVRVLAARADADSLATAAALSFSNSRAVPSAGPAALQLIARASELSPDSAAIGWLHLQLCAASLGCDSRDAATVLRWVDPDNGAAWLARLSTAHRDKDTIEIDRVLADMAHGTRFDLYYNRLLVLMFDALSAVRRQLPGGVLASDAAKFAALAGIAHAELIPPLSPLAAVCRDSAGERRENCLKLAKIMQKGDTVIVQMSGFNIEKSLLPPESREARSAADRKRLLEWRTATAEKLDASILPWTRNARTRTRLAEMRLRPREEDVCIALLREHKMALEPAENHR